MSKASDTQTLEDIVDRMGLVETVNVLAEICAEKADHIRASYDDDELADEWDGLAETLESIDWEDEIE